MATTLPGSSPSFNKTDVPGTVKALCNYTRSLQENIDFILGQLKKDQKALTSTVEKQGSSINILGGKVSSLESGLSTVRGQVSSLSTRLSSLESRVLALENR